MGVVKGSQEAEKIDNAARSAVKRLHGVEAVVSQLMLTFEKAFEESKHNLFNYSET